METPKRGSANMSDSAGYAYLTAHQAEIESALANAFFTTLQEEAPNPLSRIAAILANAGKSVQGQTGALRGVRVGWLRSTFLPLVLSEVGRHATTADVCRRLVLPSTHAQRCRYVELPIMEHSVGRAVAFASHCWGNSFADLVAALCHVLSDATFVWIDIFAVCQHAGAKQASDLDFVPVVQSCGTLILCAAHLQSVAEMNLETRSMTLIPKEDRKRCAFWRVWCLVELAAAAAMQVPVIMLVGAAADGGSFIPDNTMLKNLGNLVDVGNAEYKLRTSNSSIERISA